MPIMALFRSSRVDRAKYDAIIEQLDLERSPPPGAMTHTCGFDENGICVADVWNTREDFEAFMTDRLAPVFAKLNLDMERPAIIDVYAMSATDAVDRYKPALAVA
ncbi:hypothetical protein DJ021_13455 [Phenylobacterium hankyongense]|uniref:Antibiotic biosynthesis monooxygenase n=1 Tax=Phenylobacterium hankyongense TaxID=1813876 RepID=A0A328B028_9CAUL|nr:hypothetical protein [Phenylobacterium hankyongense]RAK60742.1 hypothetical protein DJ021_13455 [Phenylobacterium hankyongense]